MNVAVGGNFFPDNMGNKPWFSISNNPMKGKFLSHNGLEEAAEKMLICCTDFWTAKDQWYPTWPSDVTQRGMGVKSVKMWKQC